MNKLIINGTDVSECEWLNTCGKKIRCVILQNDVCASDNTCQGYRDCYFKQFKRLQEENEKIKKQYNCYACGNCTGTEDYINLEKHHKGLRKQFDEFVKRNNTLSLRIEELEKENKELKFALDVFNKACKKINVENIEKSFNTYIEHTKNLQKENEELKENVEILQNQIIQEHEQYNNLTHDSIDDLKLIRKYKQALEEIRKWATNHNPCDIDPEVKCTKEDCFNCLNYDIKKITRIIDEVLNDRD